MAKSSSYVLGLACFAVAVAMAGATRFQVGGTNGWSVPASGAESLNAWAMKNRFQIGDTLEFVYPSDQDSVLLVEPADYNACNTSSYDKKFTDGDTVVTLDRAGAFFFISGVEANCRSNEKLIVMVLAAGRNGTGGAPAPSTAPSPPASSSSPPPVPSSTPPPAASPPPPAPVPPAASPPPASSAAAPPAPTTTPSTPPPASAPPSPPTPSASAPASAPPPAPTGTPPRPSSASSPSPNTAPKPANSRGKSSPPPAAAKSNDRNGAAITVAVGLAGSLGASIVGYAMLAL